MIGFCNTLRFLGYLKQQNIKNGPGGAGWLCLVGPGGWTGPAGIFLQILKHLKMLKMSAVLYYFSIPGFFFFLKKRLGFVILCDFWVLFG